MPPPSRDTSTIPPPGGASSRHLRRLLALLLVAVLAVPAVIAADRVAIDVDGETVSLRTYGGTVDEALESAGVEVGPRDRVVPAREASVEDGLDVSVLRAVEVPLEYRGHVRVLPVAGETVEDVLVAAGLGEVEGVSVAPDPDTPLDEVDRVEVARPVTVRVTADDQVHVVRLGQGGTVSAALDVAGIEVDRRDEVSLPLGRELSPEGGEAVEVTVTRVDREIVVEEVEIPFDEKVVETAERFEDERVVTQEGAPGLREVTYRVTRVDGEVTDRERVSREVVEEPVERVVEVGTKARPAPEPVQEAVPEPQPEPQPEAAAPAPSSGGVWDRLAQCESGGNWQINTGNGYYGGLQFALQTWRNVGGSGYPHENSKAEQIRRAEILLDRNGGKYSRAWPSCSRKLGLP